MSTAWPISEERQNCVTCLVVFHLQLYVLHGDFHFYFGQAPRPNHQLLFVPSHRFTTQYLLDCQVLTYGSLVVLWICKLLDPCYFFWILDTDWIVSRVEAIFLVVEETFSLLDGESGGFDWFVSNPNYLLSLGSSNNVDCRSWFATVHLEWLQISDGLFLRRSYQRTLLHGSDNIGSFVER